MKEKTCFFLNFLEAVGGVANSLLATRHLYEQVTFQDFYFILEFIESPPMRLVPEGSALKANTPFDVARKGVITVNHVEAELLLLIMLLIVLRD